MDVFTHSPVPSTGGSKTMGTGMSATGALTSCRGTTGRLNMMVTGVSGGMSRAFGSGMTWATSR
jgi:hypothetical protein